MEEQCYAAFGAGRITLTNSITPIQQFSLVHREEPN